MNKFNKVIKNLELRSCDIHLTSQGELVTAEIVQWIPSDTSKPFCIVIAYWRRDSEGFYLHFVGSRPFDSEVISTDFWQLCVDGQNILDKVFVNDDI